MPDASVDVLRQRLDRVRGAIRSLFVLDGASRLLLVAALFAAATFALDWLFILPKEVRLVLLLAGLGAAAWTAARRLVQPLRVPITDDDLSLFVERHYPELKDRLISAIQLSREAPATGDTATGFNSPELVDSLVRDAAEAAGPLDFSRVLVRRHILKIALGAAAFLLVLGAGAAARPDLARIWADRIVGGSARWPQRTRLVVLDFDPATRSRTFAKGDDVTLAVRADGVDPGKVRIEFTFENEGSNEETMAKMGDRYQRLFPHLSGPFRFRVVGGDDESDVYQVLTQNPPGLQELHAWHSYPAYLDLQDTPADRPEVGGNVQAPIGTKLRLAGVSSEDLASARLLVGPKGREKATALALENDAAGKPRRFSGGFEIAETYTEYQIDLVAVNTLANRDPIRYTVKGLADQKPVLQVFEPAGDENVTELCRRPLKVVISDDYGVASAGVEVRVAGNRTTDWKLLPFGPDHNRPREFGRSVRKVQSEFVLDVASLGAKEGEYVELKFAARDWRDPEANVAASRVYRFAVVSVTALEAELQQAIEKIKQGLVVQQGRQRVCLDRSAAIEKKHAATEKLGPEAQGDVRGAAFEQQGVAEKLDVARKDIDRVRLRGVWNSVFDERAAKALEGASEELQLLTGDPADPNSAGAARLASTLLVSASRAPGRERLPLFGQIQNLQGTVLEGIARALRHLDNWSTYQQIVSLVRQMKEALEKGKADLLK